MTRPITSRSGVRCYGAAGDAVEIQRAGGMNNFKKSLYEEGYKAGIAAGYEHAFKSLEKRVSALEGVKTPRTRPGTQLSLN